MNKKLLMGLVFCGMAVGSANALFYRGSGNWTDTTPSAPGPGWQSTVPGSTDTAELRLGNTVTLGYAAPSVASLQIGRGRTGFTDDRSGTLNIQSGGSVTSSGDIIVGLSGNTAAPVANYQGTLNINAGGLLTGLTSMRVGDQTGDGPDVGVGVVVVDGTLTLAQHLWFGRLGGIGTMTINNGGVVNVGGGLGLGTSNGLAPSGGTGTLTVESGGLLALNTWNNDGTNAIQSGSVLNINGTGVVTINGDRLASADSYIAAGKILTDDVSLSVTYDTVSDVTTIVAIPEPATLGMVAAFGGALIFIRRRMSI